MDEKRFIDAQRLELEYWRNTPHHPTGIWKYYEKAFESFLESFKRVADVGCGPVPFFCNDLVHARTCVAIDPLFEEYLELKMYPPMRTMKWWGDTSESPDSYFDGVFALNMLDHVLDPRDMLKQLQRILIPGGLLYIYVDLDKRPDAMHPHAIRADWLLQELAGLTTILSAQDQSWKFDNRVLFYVGRKP